MNPVGDGPSVPTSRQRVVRVFGWTAVLLWAFAVGFGFDYIWAYSAKPGTALPGPAVWPGSTLITPQPGQPTLVMFVHPQCPCSRASLEELRIVMGRTTRPLSAWVLFLKPQETDGSWENTALWKAAAAIPGLHVAVDSNGTEAERFGASTSGHTVLYDARGQFLFSGGLTGSRGHVGENGGLRQVLNLLDGKAPLLAGNDFPVFGCSLKDPPVREP